MKHNFKKLIIWQDAMDLCIFMYQFTETLPSSERFNLVTQLQKCGVSIPSNIAEGSGKRTNIHFAEFLTTSLSSCYETETQLLLCEKLNFGDSKQRSGVLYLVTELQTKIYSFREMIENSK
jgi:four helix bundle protein